MIDEEDSSSMINLVTMALSQTDDIKKFFRMCFVIFVAKKKEVWFTKARDYMVDEKLSRDIGLLDSIKENAENKVLYYGDDKGSADPLRYRTEIEERVILIELELLEYLGELLAELYTEDGLEI